MAKKLAVGNLLFHWWRILILKDYLKTLNNNLDGFNIDFFEDEKESVWMMANAYYKLISDFASKNQKVKQRDEKLVKTK